MQIIFALLFIMLLGGLYIFSYVLNSRTEKPEGTVEIDCDGCSISNCSERKEQR